MPGISCGLDDQAGDGPPAAGDPDEDGEGERAPGGRSSGSTPVRRCVRQVRVQSHRQVAIPREQHPIADAGPRIDIVRSRGVARCARSGDDAHARPHRRTPAIHDRHTSSRQLRMFLCGGCAAYLCTVLRSARCGRTRRIRSGDPLRDRRALMGTHTYPPGSAGPALAVDRQLWRLSGPFCVPTMPVWGVCSHWVHAGW